MATISEVEDVQRRAAKMIGKLKNLPFSQRLAILQLPSLEHRRKRGDMIEVFKIQSGLYKTDMPIFNTHSGRDKRGYCKKLSKERCTT